MVRSRIISPFRSMARHANRSSARLAGAVGRGLPPAPREERGAAPGGGGTGGTQQAPRIFILLPSSGPAFTPIGIVGANFDRGTTPYINGTPSIMLFTWSVQNIPLIGSLSVGFTIVPPDAPRGTGDVVIEYRGRRSNAFPFTVQ